MMTNTSTTTTATRVQHASAVVIQIYVRILLAKRKAQQRREAIQMLHSLSTSFCIVPSSSPSSPTPQSPTSSHKKNSSSNNKKQQQTPDGQEEEETSDTRRVHHHHHRHHKNATTEPSVIDLLFERTSGQQSLQGLVQELFEKNKEQQRSASSHNSTARPTPSSSTSTSPLAPSSPLSTTNTMCNSKNASITTANTAIRVDETPSTPQSPPLNHKLNVQEEERKYTRVQKASALVIQTVVRMYLGNQVATQRRHAVVRMQCFVRQQYARKELERRQAAMLVLIHWTVKLLQKVRTRKSIILQAFARMVLAKRVRAALVQRQVDAAVTLQCLYRVVHAKRMAHRLATVKAMDEFHKAHQIRCRARLTVQSFGRQVLAKRELNRRLVQKAIHELESSCAITLQTLLVRPFLARAQLRLLRLAKDHATSALRIQTFVRMYFAKKELSILKRIKLMNLIVQQFHEESQAMAESFMVAWSMGHVLVPASDRTLQRAGLKPTSSWSYFSGSDGMVSKAIYNGAVAPTKAVVGWIGQETYYLYLDTVHLYEQTAAFLGQVFAFSSVLPVKVTNQLLFGVQSSCGYAVRSAQESTSRALISTQRSCQLVLKSTLDTQWQLQVSMERMGRRVKRTLDRSPGIARLLRFLLVNVLVFVVLQSRKWQKRGFRSSSLLATSDGYSSTNSRTIRTGKNTMITIDAQTLAALTSAANNVVINNHHHGRSTDGSSSWKDFHLEHKNDALDMM